MTNDIYEIFTPGKEILPLVNLCILRGITCKYDCMSFRMTDYNGNFSKEITDIISKIRRYIKRENCCFDMNVFLGCSDTWATWTAKEYHRYHDDYAFIDNGVTHVKNNISTHEITING